MSDQRGEAIEGDGGQSRSQADGRNSKADDRDRTAEERDRISDAYQRAAETRDERADARDRRAEAREQAASRVDPGAGSDRAAAWRDRREAAADRQHAGGDREAAATDRDLSARERAASSIDDLTGAYRREAGLVELARELARAKRRAEPFVLAFVDVDGLKATNDSDGHAAGDLVLRSVVDTLRTHLRSYDLTVRVGGDEFVCALLGVTMQAAEERFALINADLASGPRASITAGFAELQLDDSLDDLIARGCGAAHTSGQPAVHLASRPFGNSRAVALATMPKRRRCRGYWSRGIGSSARVRRSSAAVF
jgi:diguanylate cyclase (GGDEF)-like protein